MPELPKGVLVWPQMLDLEAQNALLSHLREAVAVAPLFTPAMPRTGKPLSVQMTNMGELGWLTDKERGYRYQSTHPLTEKPWPPIPTMLLNLWNRCAPHAPKPQACLVNYYRDTAKMGLHQDRDEQNLEAPVVSISLGDTCLFRLGGTTRGGKTQSFKLHSGDVMMLSGPARLAFHGVDRVYPGTSDLLKGGGRINLTLRVVG
ncbi:MAG: alpha-ketoglutarate-dependent dioxygenase AlkB [Pseudomonadota bacterium]